MFEEQLPNWVKKQSIKINGLVVSVVANANLESRQVHFSIHCSGWLSRATGPEAVNIKKIIEHKIELIKQQKEAQANADGWHVVTHLPNKPRRRKFTFTAPRLATI
jgi:hypothetical protein